MNQPWKIVEEFQERLKSTVAAKNNPVPLNATVQQFLPSHGVVDLSWRINNLKQLVNESSKVADESRPRGLNDSLFSFCNNCSCSNCLNQSTLFKLTDQQPISPMDVIKSYDQFLEIQRQQFILFLEKSMTAHNNPVKSDGIQQEPCNGFSSSSIPDQTPMECDSSLNLSSKEANTYCYFGSPETENISPRADKSTQPRCTASPLRGCANTCAVEDDISLTNPVGSKDGKIQDVTVNAEETEPNKRKRNDSCNDLSSCGSFEEQSDNFRFLRRSKSKSNEISSTVNVPLNIQIENLDHVKRSSKVSAQSTISMKTKKKMLHDLSVIFNEQVPKIVLQKLESSINVNSSGTGEESDSHNTNKLGSNSSVPNTRSGRCVQKPGKYWDTASRRSVPTKIERVEESEQKSKASSHTQKGQKRPRKKPLTERNHSAEQEDEQSSRKSRKRRKSIKNLQGSGKKKVR